MVANQTLVASVDASARGRSNTVFAAHMWGGNALGAFLASAALDLIGWLAVCGLAIAAAGVAMWVEWRARP
jgi:hypothetical protein